MAEPTQSDTPQDRLTRMCDSMTKTFDLHPEHRAGDRCIVFLDDGKTGGFVLHGYEDHREAIIDVLQHLRAWFRVNGMEMDLVAIPEDASGLEGNG